jgi:hypothetical protein
VSTFASPTVSAHVPLRGIMVGPAHPLLAIASKPAPGTVLGITRITMAQPRCINTLTRKRDLPARLYETSQDPCSRRPVSACLLLPIRPEAILRFDQQSVPATG